MNKDSIATLADGFESGLESGKSSVKKDFSGTSALKEIPSSGRCAIRMGKNNFGQFQRASNEVTRHINSLLLLNLVREHQPISRADLMRYSGLQRSTVSVIVEQLIANRWLREGNQGESIRGRRPTFLHLNENRLGIVGINIQPCLMHIGLADLNGRFVVRETIPMPIELDHFLHQVSRIIHGWMGQFPFAQIEEIGLSLPGPTNPSSRQFTINPDLHWNIDSLKEKLESATGLGVCIETTANSCALSEMWFNPRLKNTRDIVVVTVSESIGVGIVLNGQLVRGRLSSAGGFGHVIINETGPQCCWGHRGCWEAYASNLAAVRCYNELCPPRSRVKCFDELLRLVDQNDGRAIEALKQMSEYLGAGISMLVSGLAPDFVSVTGDITRCWDKAGLIVLKAVQKRVFRRAAINIIAGISQPPPGLQGVIALVLQNYFASSVNI